MQPGRERLPAIDYLKAAAIVAVVFTHAGHLNLGGARTQWDLLLSSVWVRFHVPTFLICSGFLYARSTRTGWSQIGARLTRVLLPYLLASLLAQAMGLTSAENAKEVLFELTTASAVGIYYYVFLIVLCIPLIWPLARMPVGAIWVAWGACIAYTVALLLGRDLRIAHSVLWAMRNPLENFSLGFFLSGWLAALHLTRIGALYERAPRAWAGVCALGVAYGWAAFAGLVSSERFVVLNRIVYTFCVVGAISILTRQRSPGVRVLFLSEAGLCIYLYHWIFQRLSVEATWFWPPVSRIAMQVAIGLAGAVLVAWLGRRLLGARRARLLLGA